MYAVGGGHLLHFDGRWPSLHFGKYIYIYIYITYISFSYIYIYIYIYTYIHHIYTIDIQNTQSIYTLK